MSNIWLPQRKENVNHQFFGNEILVIGLNNRPQDTMTLDGIALYLLEQDEYELSRALIDEEYDIYDMATLPEKGDAVDHITKETKLVIALHLFGIDHIPRPINNKRTKEIPYFYPGEDGSNGNLLPKCMELGIPLVCWGDQPWSGVKKKTQIRGNQLWIYENYHKNKK